MWGFIFHAARGLMTPFGLLMVLQTPVVSGAGEGNREIREGKSVSNYELLYQLNWATGMVGLDVFGEKQSWGGRG